MVKGPSLALGVEGEKRVREGGGKRSGTWKRGGAIYHLSLLSQILLAGFVALVATGHDEFRLRKVMKVLVEFVAATVRFRLFSPVRVLSW